MKTCVVFGARGFVGRYLVRYLRHETDWHVIGHHGDLTVPVNDIPVRIDYVINLASISSVPQSIENPAGVFLTNSSIVINVLEFVRRVKPERFIHFSSVEADTASNPYAASKAAQEALVTAYHHTYGLPATIVVSHNIIGPDQTPDKFVPKIIEQIRAGQPVTIYEQDGMIGRRTYNPVENVASGLQFVLEHTGADVWDRFLIDGGREMDNLAMAQLVARKLNRPLEYELTAAANVRPGYAPFLKSKGRPLSELGWKPPQTLEEGLAWIR